MGVPQRGVSVNDFLDFTPVKGESEAFTAAARRAAVAARRGQRQLQPKQSRRQQDQQSRLSQAVVTESGENRAVQELKDLEEKWLKYLRPSAPVSEVRGARRVLFAARRAALLQAIPEREALEWHVDIGFESPALYTSEDSMHFPAACRVDTPVPCSEQKRWYMRAMRAVVPTSGAPRLRRLFAARQRPRCSFRSVVPMQSDSSAYS
jgi:hypothetical protein